MSGQLWAVVGATRQRATRNIVSTVCLGAVAVFGACSSPKPETAVALDGLIGVYHFSERIAGAPGNPPIVFEGEFTVIGDTIKVDARPGPCRYAKRNAGVTSLSYQCGDITVTFDRRNPVERSTYSMTVVIPIPQQPQCSATVRRNCTTSTDQATERTETRHGKLTAVAVR